MHSRAARRSVLVAAVMLVLCLVGASMALACEDPTISLNKTVVEPGDQVGYSISPIQDGADWRVEINGEVVDSGTKSGNDGEVTGQFIAPDSATRDDFKVYSYVDHTSGHPGEAARAEYQDDADLSYARPAAPAAQEPGTSVQDDSPAAPQAEHQPATSADPRASGPDAGGPATDGAPVLTGSDPSGRTRSGQNAGARTDARTDAAAEQIGAAIPQALAQAQPTQAVARVSVAERASGAQDAAVRTAADDAVRTPVPVPDRHWAEPPRAAPQAQQATESLPLLIPALVLLALAGGAALTLRARRRGGAAEAALPPPPAPPPVPTAAAAKADDVAIEAELQEMIAEARARELGVPGGEPDDAARGAPSPGR